MATHDDIGKTNPTFHANENELSSTKQTQTNRNRSSPIKATYAEPNVCAACLVDVKHPLSCISPPRYDLANLSPPPSYTEVIGQDSATSVPSETPTVTMLTKTTQTQDEPPVNVSTGHIAENTVLRTTPPIPQNTSSTYQDVKQINFTKRIQDIAIFLLRSAIALIFLILAVINRATCYSFGKEFMPLLPLGILQVLYFYVILKHKDKKYIETLSFCSWMVSLTFAALWLFSKPNTICKTCQYPSNLKNVSKVCENISSTNRVFVGFGLGLVVYFVFILFLSIICKK